ncbi:hypothetical protein DFH09DRAFT_1504139 [Mycena vulgaris]|nr:hypothetical protein DFH09DRAFT_1504139 [Mycena vulgaris]
MKLGRTTTTSTPHTQAHSSRSRSRSPDLPCLLDVYIRGRLWEDDDAFYAAYAGDLHHPRRFPAILPCLLFLDSRLYISIAPRFRCAPRPSTNPTPIFTSLPLPSRSSLAVPPSRAPPRTPVPTDAQSGNSTVLAASLSPLLSPEPFSARSPSPSPSSSPSLSSNAHCLAALLSPPPAAEPHGVPSDVDDEWDEWHASNDVPFSPLVAPAPASSSSPSPIEGECSPIEYAAAAADENEQLNEDGAQAGYAYFPPTPLEHEQEPRALHSPWSSSTLFSVRSARAHAPRSPSTFAFARRYVPSASPAKAAVKPAACPSLANVGRALGGKKGKGKRLTATAVRVLRLGVASPSTSSSSFSSPASTSTAPTSPPPSSPSKPLRACSSPPTPPFPLPLFPVAHALRSLHDPALRLVCGIPGSWRAGRREAEGEGGEGGKG